MDKVKICVNPQEELHELGNLFGIFFEDISYASDGGLYGELVQNRSFEYDHCDNEKFHSLYGWEKVERKRSLTRIHVETKEPAHEKNPHYLKIEVTQDGLGGGIRNDGFYQGIPVEEGSKYLFSCDYRVEYGSSSMLVRLEKFDGTVIEEKEMKLEKSKDREWKRTAVTLEAGESTNEAYLVILFQQKICISMDMISLFPEDTFRNRENGLRKDLAQMLCDMKPKFVRFPGGCFMHIGSLDADDRSGMFRWKNTIGPVGARPARTNQPWHYHVTGGLGFYEFFLFCEDIGAEPLPVVSGGVDPHNLRYAPLDRMQEWIDEACDLIEFANGGIETKWGKLRGQMGHPEPFRLKYLAIGNEEVGKEFFERYEIICNAVHERYPEIHLIGSSGPGESGSEFDKGWKLAGKTPTSFVDEHYYQAAEWLIAHTDRYQSYNADGARAFLGEYASKGNTLFDALAESAYMTGIEKSKGIGLACYAPLFASRGYENWSPNLIWFDKKQVFGSISYYVQKLFMNYQGDVECGIQVIERKDKKKCSRRYFEHLTGSVRLFSDGMDVEFSHVKINGKEVLAEKSLNREENQFLIGEINEDSYEISFLARKKSGTTMDALEGPCFGIEFAVLDESNKLIWALDGWEQLNSIRGIVEGQVFTLGDAYYEMPGNQWVSYRIEVRGGKIITEIDGKEMLQTEIYFPEHQTLYCCASKDRSENMMIIKVVNVNEKSVKADISFTNAHGQIQKGKIWTLAGSDPKAENSFENPKKVVPRYREISAEQMENYEFPPFSLTIFCITMETERGV